MIKCSLSAILAFLFFILFHWFQFHFFPPYEKSKSIFYVWVGGFLIYLLLVFFLPSEEWLQNKLKISDLSMSKFVYPVLGILIYAFLFLGYLEFYFTADRSITFRMLMITRDQPNNAITYSKMYDLYDVPGIIEKRFEDLTYGGYLEKKGDQYYLTAKGHVVTYIYSATIEFLKLSSGKKQ